jgi:hypothetical protein
VSRQQYTVTPDMKLSTSQYARFQAGNDKTILFSITDYYFSVLFYGLTFEDHACCCVIYWLISFDFDPTR